MFEDESTPLYYNPYFILITLTSLFTLGITTQQLLERTNRLNYPDRTTRTLAGFIRFFMMLLHTQSAPLALPEEAALLAAGPHRTGMDGIALGVRLEGKPPRPWATNLYNRIPGVGRFLNQFGVIFVDDVGKAKGHVTVDPVTSAVEVVNKGGRFAAFPQGNLCYEGQESHPIFDGMAKVAIQTGKPIYAIRLDGFWSVSTRWIPLSIRNSSLYRLFGTLIVPNNIRPTHCHTIDWHLREENKNQPEAEKIRQINAVLYAYFRHTGELSPAQIDRIKLEIESGKHLEIWDNRFKRFSLQREQRALERERDTLESDSAGVLGFR